ncbi:MAG TPA: M23 family metallopeptidase [Longimicrobiales bacterium]|nr:M23 family metallopeptidase [Longimicrobiales bacterium]
MTRRLALLALLLLGGCTIPRWPVQGPMTSAFGVRWRGTLPEIHRGVDIYVASGTPVRAMAGGRIRFAGVQGDYGNVIWIDHGGSVLSVYAHLAELSVRTGEGVAPGQVIGRSGASGNASGPHLHFEVWRWGRQVDPVPLLGGRPAGN